MKLTLDGLIVLDAIAKKGSFSAAADALHRVPSTITYTVQKLEQDLGFMIFRRQGRRAILTPAGQTLLQQGRELLIAADRIVENAHQVDKGWESQLNITLDTLWDIEQFLPLVSEFYNLNTGVQVNLNEEVMGGSLDAIIQKKADIIIGAPPPISPITGIKFQQITTSQWLFVVAKDHPLTTFTQPLSEHDISDYTAIIIKDSSISSPIVSHRIFKQTKVLRVASMEHKIIAQLQGLGVGFLPKHRIRSYLASGELVALTINKNSPDTAQYCAWHTHNKGKAMRWFLDKIINHSWE